MLLLVLGGREWSCLEELYYIMLSLLAPTSCSAIVMGAIVDGVSSFCFVPASRIPLFLLKSLKYSTVSYIKYTRVRTNRIPNRTSQLCWYRRRSDFDWSFGIPMSHWFPCRIAGSKKDPNE